MLRNLLKTWQTLAPEEVRYDEHGLVWLKDPYTASLTIEPSSDGFLWPYEKSILQGCIQKCIEDRGWAWRIETGVIQNNRTWTAGVTPGGVFGDDCEVVAQYEKPACLALLTAYLTVLAAQRSLNPGAWQHFKGDTMEIVAVASPVDSGIPIGDAKGLYVLEDAPEQVVVLGSQGHFSTSYWDYKDRVFYHHLGVSWARKTEDFLGLIGSEHPDHQGKLRFTEVSHAKA